MKYVCNDGSGMCLSGLYLAFITSLQLSTTHNTTCLNLLGSFIILLTSLKLPVGLTLERQLYLSVEPSEKPLSQLTHQCSGLVSPIIVCDTSSQLPSWIMIPDLCATLLHNRSHDALMSVLSNSNWHSLLFNTINCWKSDPLFWITILLGRSLPFPNLLIKFNVISW